jgi:hypothetical protein
MFCTVILLQDIEGGSPIIQKRIKALRSMPNQ